MADLPDSAAAAEAHASHEAEVAVASAPLAAMSADLLKAVALIDGGAAFGTLLVIAASIRDARPLAFWLVFPLALFGFGTTVAAFATGFSYLAQSRRAEALALRHRIAAPPFVVETEASRTATARSARFLRLAMGSVLVAMASAVAGFLLAGAILLVQLR